MNHKNKQNFCAKVIKKIAQTLQDQATDVILTLGQAFELAYQMALREQVTSKSKSNKEGNRQHNTGTTSSSSMISPGSVSSHSKDFKDQSSTTNTSITTSSRTTDLKLNGHPLKMKPLTLSIAADKIDDNHQRETPTTKVNNASDIEA